MKYNFLKMTIFIIVVDILFFIMSDIIEIGIFKVLLDLCLVATVVIILLGLYKFLFLKK